MREEFKIGGDSFVVTDDGIYTTEYNLNRKRFFPYGSIESAKLQFDSFNVEAKANGNPKSYHFMFCDKSEKARFKSLLPTIKSMINSAQKADVVELGPAKSEAEVAVEKQVLELLEEEFQAKCEHRKRCRVCGHVFCYTDADIKANNRQNTAALFASIGSVAASFSGSAYHMYEQNKNMNAQSAKVKDFSRCPNCNSVSLETLTKEEFKAMQNKSESPTQQISAMDELKKLKELLDMGIITQEEFDAKKKQLLGL